MWNLIYVSLLVVFATFISCNKNDDENILVDKDFEFVAEYTATVTVGGVVGITERTFNVGEVYKGIDNGAETITIRIAEHTELNEDCPSSSCYQEFLSVPRGFLKILQ